MLPNPAELGIFMGTVLLLAPLIPVWRMKMAKKNKKDIKTVFYEPTQLKMWLYYIPTAFVLMLFSIIPHAFPGYSDWIASEIDRDTFWSGLIMILHIFIPLYGPVLIYAYYIFMRYDKVIEYDTPEWRAYREMLKQKRRF